MSPSIAIIPVQWAHRDRLLPLMRSVAAHHELDTMLPEITLVIDDLAADERSWLSLRDGAGLTLYCHEDLFLRDSAASLAMRPPSLPWELGEKRDALPESSALFSTRKTERYLHHQFLAVRDLLAGVVRPGDVSGGLAEAYQEAWAVTVDGRLRRGALPGHPVAERRRRFFRTFSATGMLLPQHWDIFHTLWDCNHPNHEQLLELAAALPGLASG
ncbi:hypothetical protein H8E07_15755 [bacterium]|nr:hypothetical protein [bacterium]